MMAASAALSRPRSADFWFVTGPQAWNPIVRQLATAKKLDIVDSARLFALVAMATNDAFVAVFDAKYHYNFWRPVTAIRNADLSDNPATQRDQRWLPLGDTPMHPEYPCAHCITSSAAATVLQSVFGNDIPEVSMTSASAPGVTRRWTKLQDYADEVAVARIYGGFHYRFSTSGRTWVARSPSSRSKPSCAALRPLPSRDADRGSGTQYPLKKRGAGSPGAAAISRQRSGGNSVQTLSGRVRPPSTVVRGPRKRCASAARVTLRAA